MRRGLLHGLVVVFLPACQQVSGLSSLDFSDASDPGEGGSAGEAGEAGAAGGAGVAGKSGGGTGGQAGKAGTGGLGGSGGLGGQAGQAGQGGQGGQAGLAGGGQGGASGAGMGGSGGCGPTNLPPKLAMPKVDAAASTLFSIDLSATTDAEGDAVTFAFSPTGDAPPIAQTVPGGPVATGLAGECGIYTYSVVATDACGHSAGGSVTLTVGKGPHVSGTTCDPSNECGSIKHPFCQIQPAIDASLASPIKVASGAVYDGIQMKGGVDVEGGYEPSFLQARDPASHEVVIKAMGEAGVMGPLTDPSTLDGVTVRFFPDPGLIIRAAILHAGAGTLALSGVTVDQDPGLLGSAALNVYGVFVDSVASGSLFIDASQVTAAGAGKESVGLRVAAGATTKIQVSSTSLQAGAGVDSVGLWSEGAGFVTMSTGKAAGASGTMRSAGLRVWGAPGALVEGAKVTAAMLLGGAAPEAVGADAARAKSLSLVQVSADGQGRSDDGAVAIGVRAIGVEQTEISKAVLVIGGSQAGFVGTGTGVSLAGAEGTTSAATLTDCKIRGGTSGAERVGVDTSGVALAVELGDIAGSSDPGGQRSVGVWVHGSFQPDDKVRLHATKHLMGGQPVSTAALPYRAYGVEVDAVVPVEVSDNEDIEGCFFSCTGDGSETQDAEGAGVRLRGGAGRVITGNKQILGGGHNAAPGVHTLHAGVLGDDSCALPPCPLDLELSNNPLVVGNDDENARPDRVYGALVVRPASCVVTGNQLLLGGLAKAQATGLAIDGGGKLMGGPEVNHNRLVGGGAVDAVGLSTKGVRGLLAEANEIHGCSADVAGGTEATLCLDAKTSQGLRSESDVNALIVNNYVFGGFGAEVVGCALAGGGQPVDGGAVELRFNLCLAQGRMGGTKAVGLQLLGVGGVAPVDLRVVDNILGTAGRGTTRLGVEELLAGTTYDTFWNNDFLPDPGIDQAGVALYLQPEQPAIDAVADINLLGNHQQNVSLDPAFAAPQPDAASNAGYHLDATCALGHLGQAFDGALDFDGDLRATGTADMAPEIGPDECQ